jgi:hypothetical protein
VIPLGAVEPWLLMSQPEGYLGVSYRLSAGSLATTRLSVRLIEHSSPIFMPAGRAAGVRRLPAPTCAPRYAARQRWARPLPRSHAFVMVLSHSRKPAVVWSRDETLLSWLTVPQRVLPALRRGRGRQPASTTGRRASSPGPARGGRSIRRTGSMRGRWASTWTPARRGRLYTAPGVNRVPKEGGALIVPERVASRITGVSEGTRTPDLQGHNLAL